MVKALIFGAGAIGRGFLPWCLPDNSSITFFDLNYDLIKSLDNQGYYHSFLSSQESLNKKLVKGYFYSDLNEIDTKLDTFDICFIAVGPRNVEKLPNLIKKINCPIFSLENDSHTVFRIREKFSISNVYFGVPDVIASCTASPDSLEIDKNSLHTEDGVLYLESDGYKYLKAKLCRTRSANKDVIEKEWDAKLYLHNTPHCIAAYLGAEFGCEYLHESMHIPFISKTINGVIEEMLMALRKSKKHNYDFLRSYAEKEIERFSDSLLYDPIYRVARHPLRKLRPKPNGRLLGALEMCLLEGVNCPNLLRGIASALSYNDVRDDDYRNLMLIEAYGINNFLFHFLGIPIENPLNEIVSNSYNNFKSEKTKSS